MRRWHACHEGHSWTCGRAAAITPPAERCSRTTRDPRRAMSANHVHGFGRFNLQNNLVVGAQASRLTGSSCRFGRGGIGRWSGRRPRGARPEPHARGSTEDMLGSPEPHAPEPPHAREHPHRRQANRTAPRPRRPRHSRPLHSLDLAGCPSHHGMASVCCAWRAHTGAKCVPWGSARHLRG
jgi:hypothetical protein